MYKISMIATALVFIPGCALLGDAVDKAAEKVGDAVNSYCENFTPDQREVFGGKVRDYAQPHSIDVECVGDQ